MQQLSRVVSRFLREIVDKEPLPKIYVPEINNIANMRHARVRKIVLSLDRKKGRNTKGEPSKLVTLPYIKGRFTYRGDLHIGVSWNTIHAVIAQPLRKKKS